MILSIGQITALLCGAFIAIQGSINGMVGNKIGVFPVITIPVVIQIVLYSGFILFNRHYIEKLQVISTYKLGIVFLIASALLGIGIMNTMTFSVMKVGPLYAFSIIIFSQLFIGMIIEHFGLFNTIQKSITLNRGLGIGMMLIGIVFYYR